MWRGWVFHLVELTVMLMREASLERFNYCVLLSGSDYPIKSNIFIKKFFDTATKEFIGFWRLEDRPSWKHKIEYFYPIDLVPIYGHSKHIEKSYWRRLFWGRFFKYRWLMPKRSYLKGMIPLWRSRLVQPFLWVCRLCPSVRAGQSRFREFLSIHA